MTVFDWFVVATLIIMMLLAWMNGLIYEVISLVRWVVALVAAWFLSASVVYLWGGGWLTRSIAFGVIFITVSLLLFYLRDGLGKLMIKLGLGSVNAVLGALFGLCKGVLLVVVVVVLCRPLGLDETDAWKNSYSAPFFAVLADWLIPSVKSSLHQLSTGSLLLYLREAFVV